MNKKFAYVVLWQKNAQAKRLKFSGDKRDATTQANVIVARQESKLLEDSDLKIVWRNEANVESV